MILKTMAVGPYASNCYIAGAEKTKEGMVVDPGDEGEEIVAAIKGLGLSIKLIVLTHAHIDHIGGVAAVKGATGAKLCVHSGDSRWVQERPLRSTLTGDSYPAVPPVDVWLKGGDALEVGGLKFLVLHTPGHSPGSICLLGEGVLFSGDTLFNYGVGRTDLPGGSWEQLLNSIHAKLLVLPDSTVVYPGHGPETTIGAEKRGNPFLTGRF